MNFKNLLVSPDKKVKLSDYPTDATKPYMSKDQAAEKLAADIATLSDLQARLAAQNTYALLIILQGMDAAGKDGTIKHVMSGVNPSGCQVKSFKAPTHEELDHDYLWRHVKALPERGVIGIFNRSYFEEVLVVRVHPELLQHEKIPKTKDSDKLWARRFEEINNFERFLVSNGIEVLKFFLNLSKKEQKRRFLERLDKPQKNWKFSAADVKERAYWGEYAKAFEDMLSNTSTEHAPWYAIPADNKWYMHLAVADIVARKLESLNLEFPKLTGEARQALDDARTILESEQ